MRMLFDYYDTDRLIICLDPDNMDLLQDFYTDRSKTSLLEIECNFTDEYLVGHARRVGLAGDRTKPETIKRLLPTIRSDVYFESDRIRDAGFPNFYRIRERAEPDENVLPLSQFLDITPDKASEVVAADDLYAD